MSDPMIFVTGTDFSPHARAAVHRAALLAGQRRARLDVVTALPLRTIHRLRDLLGLGEDEVSAQLHEVRRLQLEILQRDLVRDYACEVSIHIVQGRAHQQLLQHARDCQAALLVIGAQGEHGPLRNFLGGTSHKLLRLIERPLLCVRRMPKGVYRSVLVAIDFSPHSQAALRLAAQLAPEASLHVVHVQEPLVEMKLIGSGVSQEALRRYREQCEADARRELCSLLLQAGAAAATQKNSEVIAGDPTHALGRRASEIHADLIVLGRAGQSILSSLFLPSTANAVLAETEADVLVWQGLAQGEEAAPAAQ
ncbi:MAG: universal stress protein [Myxococcales bacterium]|nr:universal stress protein [Myxococcales bacterium]